LFCAGTWLISSTVPSGFIPNEDQGMFYAIIQTPPGSSLERTNDISVKLQKIAEGVEEISFLSRL
jgi:HAE1 family hydrophobic/amphiphilic exporter-1